MPQNVFATGDERCLVKLLEKRIFLQPPSLKHFDPLYLRPLDKPKRDVWFQCSQWESTKSAKELATLRGLDCTKKHFINQSIRKITVHKFQKAGIFIMTKLLVLQAIATNSHYEIMQWLTCKTSSRLVASYPKRAGLPPPFQQDAFQQNMGLLVLNTTFQTALCTLIMVAGPLSQARLQYTQF